MSDRPRVRTHANFSLLITPFESSDRNYNEHMNKVGVDFETVRRIGNTLAGVEESTAYGLPALKLKGKLLATLPANRSVEPNSLVVCVSSEQRDELLTNDPEVYYLTEHYEGYDNVLVRLSRIKPGALEGLLQMAYKFRAATSRAIR